MDRRTFILLTSAASAAATRRPLLQAPRQAGGPGRLRFDLDERGRWSLSYLTGGQPVPVVRDAILGAWVADRFIALSDLEYSALGTDRPPGGEALRIRGRAAGVVLEASFFTTREAPMPLATVSLSVYPDRELPSVKGVRFLQVPTSDLLPASETDAPPLLALVETRDSSGVPRLAPLATDQSGADLPSYGILGLTRAGRGLALAFDAGDPGTGVARIGGDTVEAVSEWTPARPLRPVGDSAALHLCYDPAGDGITALRGLLAPASPADRDRLLGTPIPAGWSARALSRATVTEGDILANADICATRFDPRYCHVIAVSDGYQRALGDWETNDRFPHGHRWLTDQLHARGLQASLWIAPLAVARQSQLFSAHPDWLLTSAGDGAPIPFPAEREGDGPIYELDPAHPAAREWVAALVRRAVQEWGYDTLEIDFRGLAEAGDGHSGGVTHAEAGRLALGAAREGAGTETLLLGAGAPLQHATGFVNAMRIAPDTAPDVESPARATALRSFYHRHTWLNHPGSLIVGPPRAHGEAELWASIVAVSGAVVEAGDDLRTLPADRFEILARTLPVALPAGRPIDAMVDEPGVAPALVVGDAVYRLDGPWRLRTGDDPRYAARDFDETVWEAQPSPASWAASGHAGYTGYAWYRARFQLPAQPGPTPSARLELGSIDAVDETFVNGASVGQTGAFPPALESAAEAFRQYLVPTNVLNWGGENVVAVRVYGGGKGPGGIWSLRRERPAGIWLAEGAPDWWTVALANWNVDAADVSVPLTSLGIGGARVNAYDVWRNLPLPDVTDTLHASIAGRGVASIALRPAGDRPQLIGTTRHIVQGAIDVADETWDAGARTLRCRATNLDGRAYAATIAVPSELRPTAATAKSGGATVPCTVRRIESGHAVLEWAAAATAGDVEWEVTFAGPAPAPARKPKRP